MQNLLKQSGTANAFEKAMENQFKPGDIVKLPVEGPKMLVIEILENDQVKCFWYNKHNQPHTEVFSAALLMETTGENKSAGFFNT